MDRYNASHQRQSPNLRQALRDAISNDTALFGTIIGLPSLDVAKVIAATDCDYAAIDAEHTPYSATLLSEMVRTENRFLSCSQASLLSFHCRFKPFVHIAEGA